MQNTYQKKILDLETTNNTLREKLEGGIKFKIKSEFQPAGEYKFQKGHQHGNFILKKNSSSV